MNQNKELKNKIEKLFLLYTQNFAEDYKATVTYLQAEKEKEKNKFSSLNKNKLVHRKIYEIPETLHAMFLTNLSVEELTTLKEKEMGRWIAKRFPEFASSTHI